MPDPAIPDPVAADSATSDSGAPVAQTGDKPVLLIVNGPPASGKTTLGEKVAEQLGIPMISKDAIKEELYDSLGPIVRRIFRHLGATSMRLMYLMARATLEAGVPVIIEANFNRGLSEHDIEQLLPLCVPLQLHCDAPSDELVERYEERDENGDRHPVHQGGNAADDLKDELDDGLYEPLELDVPTLQIDTTDGYRPGIDEAVRWIRSQVPGV